MSLRRTNIAIKFNKRKFMKICLINNQECKVRTQVVNVNSEKPVFFPFSIRTSKWSGSCNNINDLYAKCML